MPLNKKNMPGDFFHDNCNLLFAGHFRVKLVQRVVNSNFPLAAIANCLCYNIV